MANQTLKKLNYDGKEVQVESAIRDGSGNTITSTYAKKTELPTKVSQLTNDSGFTANAGTVTSVRVQAGTGLSSSTSTAQSSSLNTTISIASGYKLPTTTEWNGVAKTSELLDKTYPVGSVYISKENTSPAGLIGGTWQSYGAVLFATSSSAAVHTGPRHTGNAIALNFDYISGSSTIQCNQTSAQNALISDGTSLTISQLNGASWGSNWGGYGTIIPNNLYADLATSTVYMWKRTA